MLRPSSRRRMLYLSIQHVLSSVHIIAYVHCPLVNFAKCTRCVLPHRSMSKPLDVCRLHTMSATLPRLGRAAIMFICIAYMSHTIAVTCPRLVRVTVVTSCAGCAVDGACVLARGRVWLCDREVNSWYVGPPIVGL